MTVGVMHKPRGRRPGNADTRRAIQDAALRLFSESGYEKVSLRAVARAADVDPALIHHYFENKADLFSKSVLDLDFDPASLLREVLDGPQETIGERAVSALTEAWERPGARERFIAMIRAAANDAGAHRPLAEFLCRELFLRIAESLGHCNARLRAHLAMTAVLGLVMARDILEMPLLTSMKRADLVACLGRSLQLHLVDSW